MSLDLEIVIPYYRGDQLLGEALDSLLRQSDSTWRATVLDDGSPDDCAKELVQSLADPRVTYHRQDENLGISATFEHALRLSRGRWTTIMGQDDRLLPNYVEVIRDLGSQHPSAAMIQPGVRVINATGEHARTLTDLVKALIRPSRARTMDGQRLATSVLVGNWLYFPAMAWRTSRALDIGFDPNLRTAMDLDHILHQVVASGTLVYDRRECFEYRRHARSVSSELASRGPRFGEEDAVFAVWASRLRAQGWRRAAFAADVHATSRAHRAMITATSYARSTAALVTRPSVRNAIT